MKEKTKTESNDEMAARFEKEAAAEKQEEKLEQMQFIGTEGYGIITIKNGDTYNSTTQKYYNVKWEIHDKFFHIKEKGKEVEEGLYIPMSKVKEFSFAMEGELLPCRSMKCAREDYRCDDCKDNPVNLAKLEICNRADCDDDFNCQYCDHNPDNKGDNE